MTTLSLSPLLVFLAVSLVAREYHVASSGDNAQDGSAAKPLRTISAAAELAQPGDMITVHAGTYRERINPPRGGTSDAQRITYRAASGEHVEIKGSEIVRDWTEVQPGIWQVVLANAFFGTFNPYKDQIRGDWFNPKGRVHHTGAVYLDGEWLTEAASFEVLLERDRAARPGTNVATKDVGGWFAQVDNDRTTIWADFRGANPNQHRVEINVRRAVFYPDKPGCNFITVRGFILQHAATPWAPPTAEQVGLIGTHWSKGWIIENNTIRHSICSGISLGKHGDAFDNTSANSAQGYVETIARAQAHAIPWTKEHIGHHIVRNNTVSHCEQAGIVGSLGAAFSQITGNTVHDIHVWRLFAGAEMAGIKLHGAIDTEISGNHIHRCNRGLWLDWMAQGTRVSGNLFHDNTVEDLFLEVNHGPFLIDNNVFLSPTTLLDMSQGGSYAYNLIAGRIFSADELKRETPFHVPHSTAITGLARIKGGDNRYYNNMFIGIGVPPPAPATVRKTHLKLEIFPEREQPSWASGNVYWHGAEAPAFDRAALKLPAWNPQVRLHREQGKWMLELSYPPAHVKTETRQVTTTLLAVARTSGAKYEKPDGSPLVIDRDFFGARRSATLPTAGPFENPGDGLLKLRLR